MGLFTISDLHLPLGIDKPMDIFGANWDNYVEKAEYNWKKCITDEDIVVLGGDLSWATYIEQSLKDFEFLHLLPGKKILIKGNHDYWWSTKNKIKTFLKDNGFLDIDILQNNSFMYNNIGICGTRGWSYPYTPNTDNEKIYLRELQRLTLSLDDAVKNGANEIYLFTHYPPVTLLYKETPFHNILKNYPVTKCIYGHLHASALMNAFEGKVENVEYILASGDFINFNPIKLL